MTLRAFDLAPLPIYFTSAMLSRSQQFRHVPMSLHGHSHSYSNLDLTVHTLQIIGSVVVGSLKINRTWPSFHFPISIWTFFQLEGAMVVFALHLFSSLRCR